MNNIISLESDRVRTTTRQDRRQTHLSFSIKKEKNLETRACYFSSLYTRLRTCLHHTLETFATPTLFRSRHTSPSRRIPRRNEIITGEKRHYTSRCDFFQYQCDIHSDFYYLSLFLFFFSFFFSSYQNLISKRSFIFSINCANAFLLVQQVHILIIYLTRK